jgi:ribosomal protein S18 acetylase RimI-like enzyme
MEIEVRNATLNDVDAIDNFDPFAGNRTHEVERGDIIVALIEDKVVGYLMHNRHFYQRPFVWFAAVHNNYKRRGVKKMLFNYVEDIYKGHPLIFTSTEDDNVEMLAFFEKYGYKKSGAIENLQKQVEIIFCKALS